MLKPLLEKILKPGVSDLHLKAFEPPLVRQMGQLVPIGTQTLRPEDIESIVSSILNENQRAQLKERGDLDFSHSIDGMGRLRINVYRQRGSYAIAIRVIPGACKTFEQLYLPNETFEKLCRMRRGLILISGVTGAGKTTTLNAIINHMNENYFYNIITLEDPIEFSHTRKKCSISQREVGRDVPSFSEGLKYMLRQDPDVIVLGEMREVETFQAAIEGAASGHLVLGTVHSSDTLDAVDRIVNAFDFQEQPYVRLQITNVLTAVISQRLVKDKLGRGCYPATEIMLGTMQMKKLILTNSVSEVRFQLEKGSAYGMHTFDQDLFRMVEEDLISPQDALEAASNPNDLRIKLQGAGNTNLGEPK